MIISQSPWKWGSRFTLLAVFSILAATATPSGPAPSRLAALDSPSSVVTFQNPLTGRTSRVLAGRVLIKAPLGRSAVLPLLQKYQATLLAEIPEIDLYAIGLPSSLSIPQGLQAFAGEEPVAYAEPAYFYYPADYFPNDPALNQQWALSKVGAYKAWDLLTGTHGSASIAVAVVDTGVDIAHPDLQDKILPGGYDFVDRDPDPSEDPGNGIDDDHNGLVDENVGHGTEVAGIAAAATDNGIGMAGMGFNTKIFPVRIFPPDGGSTPDVIAQAIVFAAQKPEVGVINLSLSGTETSNSLRDAIQFAYYNNKIVVAAAGNSPGCFGIPCYPAYYDEVLGVASINQQDQASSFTNHGAWVDIASPGEGIYSTSFRKYQPPPADPCIPPNLPSFCHIYLSGVRGTSFAAPFVSGVAALVRAVHPGWTPLQVMQHLVATGDDIRGGCLPTDIQCQIGPRLNAQSAVTRGDIAPPSMLLATAVQRTAAQVTFSEPLDPASITGSSCSVTGLPTSGIRLADSPDTVEIYTAPQQGGITYTVFCGGIKDTTGNQMTTQSLAFVGTNQEVNFLTSSRGGLISANIGFSSVAAVNDANPGSFATATLPGGQPTVTLSLPDIQSINRIVVRTGNTLVKYRLQGGVNISGLSDVADAYTIGDASYSVGPTPIRYVRVIVEEAASGTAHLNEVEAYRDDTTPPTFTSGPTAVPAAGPNQISVNWQTDELADSTVLYRPINTSNWTPAGNSALVTDHSVLLSSLSSSLTYEFYAQSQDGWSNATSRPDYPMGESPYTFTLNPSVTITHQPPRNFAVVGRNLPVALQVAPAPLTVTLFYGATCAGATQNVLLPGTGAYLGAIPAASVVFPRVSYYFKIQPIAGPLTTYPASGCFSVLSTIAGDTNGDLVVDELDALEVGNLFGETAGSSGFSQNQDATGDGIINGNDLTYILQHFGETAQ